MGDYCGAMVAQPSKHSSADFAREAAKVTFKTTGAKEKGCGTTRLPGACTQNHMCS